MMKNSSANSRLFVTKRSSHCNQRWMHCYRHTTHPSIIPPLPRKGVVARSSTTQDITELRQMLQAALNETAKTDSSSTPLPIEDSIVDSITQTVQNTTENVPLAQYPATTATAAAAAASLSMPGAPSIDIPSITSTLHSSFDQIVNSLPAFIQPLVATLGGDAIDILSFHFTLGGFFRLSAVSYLLFTRPAPLVAILDFYLINPLTKVLGNRFTEKDFTLRDRLGNGNYGQGMCLDCI